MRKEKVLSSMSFPLNSGPSYSMGMCTGGLRSVKGAKAILLQLRAQIRAMLGGKPGFKGLVLGLTRTDPFLRVILTVSCT